MCPKKWNQWAEGSSVLNFKRYCHTILLKYHTSYGSTFCISPDRDVGSFQSPLILPKRSAFFAGAPARFQIHNGSSSPSPEIRVGLCHGQGQQLARLNSLKHRLPSFLPPEVPIWVWGGAQEMTFPAGVPAAPDHTLGSTGVGPHPVPSSSALSRVTGPRRRRTPQVLQSINKVSVVTTPTQYADTMQTDGLAVC